MIETKPTALIHGAAKVLGVSGEITPDKVREAYRRLAMKYHPDRNPAGLVMMQALNAARDTLMNFRGSLHHAETASAYGGDLNAAINHLINCLGLDLEICGAWLWVGGTTKTYKDHIKTFETDTENRFRWHSKKGKWYFAPNDFKSKRRGKFRGNVPMEDIRERYGSNRVKTQARTAIR